MYGNWPDNSRLAKMPLKISPFPDQ
jgi:hypothetical protein